MIEPVEFMSADGVTLRGELRRAGPHWTILIHDRGADLDSLNSLADALANAEFSVLGFDLRGHGLSDGVWDDEESVLDVAAAITWAQDEGAGQIMAAAAGESAAVLFAAATNDVISAAVLLSPTLPPTWTTDRIRSWSGPKLFIVGSQDASGEPAMRLIDKSCIGPRLLIQLPTAARGHELFASESAPQALNSSVGYLMKHRTDIEQAA